VARGKKNAERLGAHIVFADESGFQLIPTLIKTWAPRGHTPLVRHRYRRDRISVISALSISPVRHRMGLYYRFHRVNINTLAVCDFLRHLLRHLRGHVIVIWDNASIHRGPLIREMCRKFARLHLVALPPELNADEGVWSLAKASLANGRPDDVEELDIHLEESLQKLRRSPRKLRSCVHRTGLPLF
jgi:transposase